MVMLRWSSEAARALYARIAVTAHARAVDVAHDAAIDVVRSHTLLTVQGGVGADSDASRVELQRSMLDAAHERTEHFRLDALAAAGVT
eukprot:5794210-Pleurochrysis_carterae.AAC.1